MKRLFLISAIAMMAITAAQAQQAQPIPVDQKVRIGHLDNGLTYYIRHNEEPKGQANFYIAQKVGSILEEDDQRGLAHFLEHMCFNGTTHFPGNNIVKYCESIGVQFGADLNAYTSIDETVYNIDNVPVATAPTAIDSCLLILHDWADGLLLNGEDIDSERGVIHEEWRSRMNATMRMYETLLPELYPGNRYAYRMPIGTMEVVDNFPYQALRDYYEKWYRPDQQGIVVVGDIDVDAVEAKIRDIFSDIKAQENPAERVYVPVEDNKEPIISMAKDKEMPRAQTFIFIKHEAVPDAAKSDLSYYIYEYALNAMEYMANQRLAEMTQTAEPPFIAAQAGDDDYFISKTKKALTGVVVTAEGGLEKGVTTLYREMLRFVRNGFTASEYERFRTEFLTQVESQYNQRDKIKSADFCSEYVRHFIDNEPIPGIETEFALLQQLAPAITVDVINQIVSGLVSDSNMVVACMLPDKEGLVYPSKEELAAALAAVEAEEIAPYEDAVSDQPLMSELPTPGKVVKSKKAQFDYTEYKLSNGATVYLKTTDFNADEVLLSAYSWGGTSVYNDSEALQLQVADDVYTLGGIGEFSPTELNKVLAGKKASASASINVYSESVSGSSTPKDFETMLQLVYLKFTSVREDDELFKSWQNRTKASLANIEANPNKALQDSLYTSIYKNTARILTPKSSEIDAVDYGRILEIGRERFADASDFKFYITGNIDEATALPLIEQYIGSLPAAGKTEKRPKNDAAEFRKDNVDCVFDRQMEIPSTTVVLFDIAKSKYDLKTSVATDLAMRALSIQLLEEIREKEGGTYSISADGDVDYLPKKEVNMMIAFQTGADVYEHLTERTREVVAEFAKNGPRPEDLAKGKEVILKNFAENMRENSFLQSSMRTYVNSGFDGITDYEKIVNETSAEDVRKVIARLMSKGNHSTIIMNGIE